MTQVRATLAIVKVEHLFDLCQLNEKIALNWSLMLIYTHMGFDTNYDILATDSLDLGLQSYWA